MARKDRPGVEGEKALPENMPCRECHKEIPHSQVYEPESEEYAMFFCGLECFDKWHARGDEKFPRPGAGEADGDDPERR